MGQWDFQPPRQINPDKKEAEFETQPNQMTSSKTKRKPAKKASKHKESQTMLSVLPVPTEMAEALVKAAAEQRVTLSTFRRIALAGELAKAARKSK